MEGCAGTLMTVQYGNRVHFMSTVSILLKQLKFITQRVTCYQLYNTCLQNFYTYVQRACIHTLYQSLIHLYTALGKLESDYTPRMLVYIYVHEVINAHKIVMQVWVKVISPPIVVKPLYSFHPTVLRCPPLHTHTVFICGRECDEHTLLHSHFQCECIQWLHTLSSGENFISWLCCRSKRNSTCIFTWDTHRRILFYIGVCMLVCIW